VSCYLRVMVRTDGKHVANDVLTPSLTGYQAMDIIGPTVPTSLDHTGGEPEGTLQDCQPFLGFGSKSPLRVAAPLAALIGTGSTTVFLAGVFDVELLLAHRALPCGPEALVLVVAALTAEAQVVALAGASIVRFATAVAGAIWCPIVCLHTGSLPGMEEPYRTRPTFPNIIVTQECVHWLPVCVYRPKHDRRVPRRPGIPWHRGRRNHRKRLVSHASSPLGRLSYNWDRSKHQREERSTTLVCLLQPLPLVPVIVSFDRLFRHILCKTER
jgi:hypothetical protein